MRVRVLFCYALFVLVFTFAVPAKAQFQQPTDEELKMTADPKAPGAAAVYLYREEVTEDTDSTTTYYERIKVLTEKGKELATVRIPYAQGSDSVADIQARTIHADGTIIPLTAKPADLMDYKVKGYQVNTIVFTLPNVEVGSILECRLKVHHSIWAVSEPNWDIQQSYFVRKAHYSFHPVLHYVTDSYGTTLDQIMYSMRVDSDAKPQYDKKKGIFTLDLVDIPAAPDEDWMPPLNTIRWNVRFYYTSVKTGEAYWEYAGKRWTEVVKEFTNPTNGLKKAVSEIVAPNDSDEQKSVKIYEAVMKLDNTVFGREKSQAERKKEKLKDINKAEDVWKQKSGTDDEITLLYVAMARAAGLKVWAAKVVARNRALFDVSFLSTRQLDDYMAIVLINGKEIYLDPGQKMCPYGFLHWKHTLAGGIRQTDKGTELITTPVFTYKNAAVQRSGGVDIDAQGNVMGSIRIVMIGLEALRWRQLALRNDLDEVKKQFDESYKDSVPDGVHAEIDHFLALDDYNSVLMAVLKVSGNIGTATGKRFFLPGLFFESHAKHPFVAQDKRSTPIDVEYPRMEQDDITYHLPAGFGIESVPQVADVSWPGFASLNIRSQHDADSVRVTRTFARNFAMLEAKVYDDLRGFYLKQAAADQQQVVLIRTTTTTGN